MMGHVECSRVCVEIWIKACDEELHSAYIDDPDAMVYREL